ncbi:bifunctional diguanylate cyclase/phosphodiesterase [Peribacillus saganii]|uniref:Bifunctional diguanylate cyclase/phosphodiesterase n=1 Tax=Peribacillus saganii TaxID=2303992 RepID=A0A372LN85_9BACI|nr:bifunctional diguanylate cyclase/phosphodiesterase [Peribacillus saganii]RFU68449.1 bifunctional diguanylate cyclase/phosphodiesterase [Peribacillus saganii]
MIVDHSFLGLEDHFSFADLVYQHMQEGVFVLNHSGEIMDINSSAEKITGFSEAELKGISFQKLFYSHQEYINIWEKTEKFDTWTGETEKVRKNGEIYTDRMKIQKCEKYVRNVCYLVFFEDISPQKKAEEQRRLADKIYENISEGVLFTDAKGRILYVNPAFQIVTGYTEDEALGNTPSILQSGLHNEQFYRDMWREIGEKGRWKGEIWNKRKSGEVFPEWLTISSILDEGGALTNYLAVFSDITEQKQAEDQLRKLAHYDVLTGAANRYLLNKRLERLLITAKKYNQILAVLFLDLDRFKLINDTLGHNYGDLLLKKVYSRLKGLLKSKDIIARLGGDEFVIVLPNIKHAREAVSVCQDIIKSLQQPFILHEQEVYTSASIGVGLFPFDGDNIDSLIKNADRAMYQAKANGKNNFELYHTGLRMENETRQMVLENGLRRAVEKKELFLQYHPLVNLTNGQIEGVEALLRWNSSELGRISPAEFIPIAEETGLIVPISEWVIKQACDDIKSLHIMGYNGLKVSINISGIHFNQDDFVKNISDIIQHTNIFPHCVDLEITESIIMPNAPEANNKLVKLKQLGIKLSIDDFGTGYSSLSYLHRLPIDRLKIDQSFIKKLSAYKEDASIVQAIITMAHTLNLVVIAEGVEREKHLRFLAREKCDIIQGYYITKPVSWNDLLFFLETWDPQAIMK